MIFDYREIEASNKFFMAKKVFSHYHNDLVSVLVATFSNGKTKRITISNQNYKYINKEENERILLSLLKNDLIAEEISNYLKREV